MSSFLNLTPSVQIIVENLLLKKVYPSDGLVTAVIDSGYQGFLSVPISVYEKLGLNRLSNEERMVSLADGTFSKAKGCYASVRFPHISMRIDGFVETFRGLDEILLGVEALAYTRVVLDYCSKRVRMEKCFRRN